MKNKINYDELMTQAMRGLIKLILEKVAATGLPDPHHFYITFATNHSDVDMADWLKKRYPDHMTIILQNWYENLEAMDMGFTVTLNFDDQLENLYIPYEAISVFADPSTKFGLRFEYNKTIEADAQHSWSKSDEDKVKKPHKDAEIVSLDKFRK